MSFSYSNCDIKLRVKVRNESFWLDDKLLLLEEKHASNPFKEDIIAKEALRIVRSWYVLVLALRITISLIPVINLIVIGLFKLFTDKSWLKINAVKQLKSVIKEKQNNKNFVRVEESTITLDAKLGQGNFGAVYQATYDKRVVAAKISLKKTSELSQDLEREGEFLSRIDSPYVLRCFGYFIGPHNAGILLEFIPHGSLTGGTLTALLKSQEVLTWDNQFQLSREMVLGLNALHKANIVHSDLKTDNILVCPYTEQQTGISGWHIKISDLGLSHFTQDPVFRGTPKWVAPEVFKAGSAGTTLQSDVYALGLMYWCVVSRQEPFQQYGKSDLNTFRSDLTQKEERPPIGEKFNHVPQRYARLVKWCWNQDPTQRPSCVEIIDELEEIQVWSRESPPVTQ